MKQKDKQEKIKKKIKWGLDKIDELEKATISKAMLEVRKAFNKIKRDVVKDWYLDYGDLKHAPQGYYRKLDLFKIPKISLNKRNGKYLVEYNPEFMTKWHRVSNEYIFENSFIKGWHGGADKLGPNPAPGYEEPHPDPGTPYWRTPQPVKLFEPGVSYVHWCKEPAARSFSPYEEISSAFKERCSEIEKQMSERFEKEEGKIIDKVCEYYEKMLGR